MLDMQIQAGAPLITSPGTNENTTAQSTPRRLLYLAVVIVAVPVYVADQLTKAWASANLQSDQPRSLIGSILQLNLTDRMFRAPGPGRGQVVDFLQLPHYPIFNIADSAIVSAAVLIAVMAFRGVSIDGTRVSSDHPKNDDPGNDDPRNETTAQGPQHRTATDHDV